MEDVITEFKDKDGNIIGYHFFCEGCETYHGVWTNQRNEVTNAKWSFNGDKVKPTFNPSILVRYVKTPKNPKTDKTGRIEGCKDMVCHSFIRDGQIQYLNDCTHKLAGKTVELRNI